MSYKAIIIDDIEQARTTLKQDLSEYAKDFEVIGEATGVVEGAKLLKNTRPDILFLDIQMQDGSGFDLLDLLPKVDFKIIFITASDAHAIKAFRYAAIDYLMKPIDPDELTEALKKFRESHIDESAKYELLNDRLKNHQKPNERLALHSQDKIQVVEIETIIRCESSVNYTTFFFKNGYQIVVTRTLKEFEDLLSDQGFFRVHQSHLVNTRQIKEYVKSEGGHLNMKDGSLIPVSVRKRPDVMKMLDAL
ncbi:LytTR family DNA-binding domain-containing protein [Crocinitomicaceae bacterium]|nr:LytTR family DNA-binding domain-containing protein [Crocinitomicaceae bacterium]MDB3906359.1 LytTR family DNA-binding domain-containing protein [Crocinitomicaceae bacterium]MDC0257708.1 LytTR family DNA-binding domain-containing protein [Crocinitomicaceae bacterium]